MKKSQKVYLPLKRLIGIIGSLIGISFCFVLFWWWVFIINLFVTKGHPIFLSERVGQNNKTIKVVKFRSMKYDANPNMNAGDEGIEEELTGFGKFLRLSSIDESLQLFNILIGQMAFIGPRPLINVGTDAITIEKRKENGSYVLKPGISGLAQLHARSDLDCIQKAQYDYEYLKKMSFFFDIKIFILTILSIFNVNKGK